MKKILFLFALTLFAASTFAQKKEKLKGSKIVTQVQKEIDAFETLEVSDNFDIFLVKGDNSAIEIEADDNLHEAIDISVASGVLKIATTKEATGFKKLSVKITYTGDFKMLIAKNNANITALTDLELDNITFKMFDASKLFATVKTKIFTMMANDKSKTELNLKAEETTIDLSKNAQLKALISSGKMKFDLYQKASATIEGDVTDLKLRLDNNSEFVGKNLTTKNTQLVTEGSANCSIMVLTKVVIEAAGKSEIQLYGDPKIEINKFTDSAVIAKKQSKIN